MEKQLMVATSSLQNNLNQATGEMANLLQGLGVGVLAPWVARQELTAGSLVSFPIGSRRLRRHFPAPEPAGRRRH